MGHYIKYGDSSIPLCWEWAWENMPKYLEEGKTSFNANDIIDWHNSNKKRLNPNTGKREQFCPHCITSYKEERTTW